MEKEIQIENVLATLPTTVKRFLLVFIGVLSFGYGTGLVYLNSSTGVSPQGIEEQYVGNEADENALEMKFKKPEKAILTLVHGHVISFGLIFFVLGGMFLFSSYPLPLKKFLAIEPLISTVTTFAGIWLVWSGVVWFKYIILVSGSLMHLSFGVMVVLLVRDLLKKEA
tara:strand:- start:29087 stop:29590 length:504 start_codon:yes stop_codon:yes gene_type:complete